MSYPGGKRVCEGCGAEARALQRGMNPKSQPNILAISAIMYRRGRLKNVGRVQVCERCVEILNQDSTEAKKVHAALGKRLKATFASMAKEERTHAA